MTLTSSAELSTYTKELWKFLCDSSTVSNKISILKEINLLLPCSDAKTHPRFSTPKQLQEARLMFCENHYARTADNLLSLLTVDWVKGFTSDDMKILDSFFLQGVPQDAFSNLVSTVCNCGPSYKQIKCVQLLSDLLKGSALQSLILAQVDNPVTELTSQSDMWDQLTVLIASVPSKMANTLKHENRDIFMPKSYIGMLSKYILDSMEKCHELLLKGKDCSLEFGSLLLGKLSLSGYSDFIWPNLLPELLMLVKKDCIWWRLSERLITGVASRCLKSVLIPLLSNIPWYKSVELLLGDAVLHNHSIQYLLCTKLLLMRYFEQTHLLQNIMGYLSTSTSRKHLLKKCMLDVLRVWGDGSAIRHTSYHQHLYLSKALLIGLSFIQPEDKPDYKSDCLRELMVGMQHHLNSPDVKIRSLGMIVAESFSKVLDPNGPQLSFEFPEDDMMTELRTLLSPPDEPSIEHLQRKMPELSMKEPVITDKTKMTDSTATGESPDLDSDDDLEPYDMSNDVTKTQVKKPFYIRECMEGLILSDKPDQVEVCLQAAESLIRSKPDGLKEISSEMMKILLHVSGEDAIEDFRGLRYKAMVALTSQCPEQVAPYLTSEFYGLNYNLRQRLDILEVISGSVRELSAPVSKTSTETDQEESSTSMGEQPDWRQIVEKRIKKKTRRFAHSAIKKEGVANRIGPVAGLFFFPLILHYDRKQNTLDLLGEDTVVLSRLLYTVGTVLHCSVNTQIVQQMGVTGLEFIWALRYHTDGSVRLAVLFCCAMVLLSVPAHFLLSTLQSQLTELKLYLQGVIDKDANEECQTLAVQVLILIDGVVQQEFQGQATLSS